MRRPLVDYAQISAAIIWCDLRAHFQQHYGEATDQKAIPRTPNPYNFDVAIMKSITWE